MIDRDKFLAMLDTLECRGLINAPTAYSGRGMYGKRCIALTGDSVSEWGLAIQMAAIADEYDVTPYDLPEPSTDSMGRGIVLYWRGLEWPEDRRDPDEDEY
jgi:hypothetical protein